MSAQREINSPAFIGLPFGSAAAFAMPVFCGPSRLALAIVLLTVVVGVTGLVSEMRVAISVAAVAWFCLVGFVLVGNSVAPVAARSELRLGQPVGPPALGGRGLVGFADQMCALNLSAAIPPSRKIPVQRCLDV